MFKNNNKFQKTTRTSQNGKIDSTENEEYWKYEIRVYMITTAAFPCKPYLALTYIWALSTITKEILSNFVVI